MTAVFTPASSMQSIVPVRSETEPSPGGCVALQVTWWLLVALPSTSQESSSTDRRVVCSKRTFSALIFLLARPRALEE